jgi:hypothetical protein
MDSVSRAFPCLTVATMNSVSRAFPCLTVATMDSVSRAFPCLTVATMNWVATLQANFFNGMQRVEPFSPTQTLSSDHLGPVECCLCTLWSSSRETKTSTRCGSEPVDPSSCLIHARGKCTNGCLGWVHQRTGQCREWMKVHCRQAKVHFFSLSIKCRVWGLCLGLVRFLASAPSLPSQHIHVRK